MLMMLALLVLLLLVSGFAGLSLGVTSLLIVLVLLMAGWFFAVSAGGLAVLWMIAAAVLAPLNIKSLRRALISAPALRLFRKASPGLSDTEREAMEAGDVWWEAELFAGNPDWRKLLAQPRAALSAREQAFLDGPVEEVCAMIDDWDITHRRKDLPPEVWDFLKREKFFGMIIPRRHGGLAFSAAAHSAVVMKLAARSITAAVTVMVPNSLGPGELLMRYGTREQKEEYLPRLADGRDIPCFALTGPWAGSDAGAMPDYGVVCRGDFGGEKDIPGIRLTFDKRYITLAPVAGLVGLAFRLFDPERLLGGGKEPGLSLALLRADTPGLDIGRRHDPLGIPFQNGPVRGRDVFIPASWLIGGPAMAGKGWRMLMEALAAGRGISLPALSTGALKLAARQSGAYAAVRRQFNVPIGKFEGVREALGRIGGLAYLGSAARDLTLSALDQGVNPAVVTAIVKYHLTESMRRAVDDAMDIHGGKGIILGPRNTLGRVYQSVPVAITVEGANILTRGMIIFGQGAIRCHPFVLREMQAAAGEGAAALEEFDDLIFRHAGFAWGNFSRTLIHGLTGARLARAPAGGPAAVYYRQFSRFSAILALVSDVSMALLGGGLKRREHVSARLGDVLSYLYLGSAVLKRFEEQGRKPEDEPFLRWACDHCLFQMQQSLRQLFGNFPVPWAGRVLARIAFPPGWRFRAPSDADGGRICDVLMTPDEGRNRLCAGIYAPDVEGEPLADLEKALVLMPRLNALQGKIRAAMKAGKLHPAPGEELAAAARAGGVITEDEESFFKEATALVRAVIDVDDFDPEDLTCQR